MTDVTDMPEHDEEKAPITHGQVTSASASEFEQFGDTRPDKGTTTLATAVDKTERENAAIGFKKYSSARAAPPEV
ncbi:hypothetical protein [Paraburkholderia sediminicola]|uniref:hypothetical protein n=1 Tax=Paraburkholderia sediminicola TaxID=458836 RepID=UPI0038B70676